MATPVEKILIFGMLSFGESEIDINPDNPPLSDFFKLTTQGQDHFFPNGNITFIYLKKAPRVIAEGTVFTKIVLFGESSYTHARLMPQSSWDKFNIPNLLSDQIVFIADERIIISSKSQIISIQV